MVISKSIIFQLFETVSLLFALAIKPLNLHIFCLSVPSWGGSWVRESERA